MVYVPNKYQQISKEIWKGYPPPLLPKNKRIPHEGRVEFKVPGVIKKISTFISIKLKF